MFKVTTKSYADMLLMHYETKTPLMVMGPPGVGKSQITMQVMQGIAEKKGRKFATWSSLSTTEKAEVKENASKWFIFLDLRLAQLDTSDLRGIIKLNSEYTQYAPQEWMAVFRQPESDGCMLFDEINQAAPIVQASCFQIILDRELSDIKVSDNIFMCAAGNRHVDKAGVFQMPFPLRDRFSEVELQVSDDEWCEYAMNNGISPHIVAYIKWKPSSLYAPPSGTEDKGSTPRGWFRFDKLLKNSKAELTSGVVYNLSASSVGEAAGTMFQAYCKVASKIDLDALLNDPKSVKTMDGQDKKYAIAGLLGEHIAKVDVKDKVRIGKMFEVAHNMSTEFGVVTLNLMRTSVGTANFKRYLMCYPKFKDLLGSIAKFIVMD